MEQSKTIQEEKILSNHRKFLKGIIGATCMEDRLKEDLKSLNINDNKRNYSDFEFCFLKQSITAVQEVHNEALIAFNEILKLAENENIMKFNDKILDYIADNVNDPELQTSLTKTISFYGGVHRCLKLWHFRLNAKSSIYGDLVQKLGHSDKTTFHKLLSEVTNNLDNLTHDQLIEYWKKKLDEAREKDEKEEFKGFNYFNVAWDLCEKYPKIAAELKINCPHYGLGGLVLLGLLVFAVGFAIGAFGSC